MKKLFLVTSFILALGATLMAQDCATGYCPATIIVHHKAGNVSPITVDITYEVVKTTMFNGTDKCAIARNLGATTQASSVTDNSVTSGGWYWQFNRKQGYHYNTSRTPATTWIASISETSNWIAANDPCTLLLGSTWRIPTQGEWYYAVQNSGLGWSNYTGPYNSVLKMHAAGYLQFDAGVLLGRGSYFFYVTSTSYTAAYMYDLNANSTTITPQDYNSKCMAEPVRCMRTY